MSFKLPIEIGYIDPETGWWLPSHFDVTAICEAIVSAGGRLLEDCGPEDNQRVMIATAIERRTQRKTLGFLGVEFVILHGSGFLMSAIGFGPHRPMLSFLSCVCRESGCQVYSPNESQFITEDLLGWLSVKAQEQVAV